jgi:tetratricopeptide (TPR) repeat protein
LENHPTAEDFECFLQASSRPSNAHYNALVIRHLLRDCQICRETLGRLRGGQALLARLLEAPLPQMEPSDSEAVRSYNYDWAFARTERVVAASLAQGGPSQGLPERLAELYRLPEGEQLRRVSLGVRFADPDLVETLIGRCHAARYQSPKKMLHLGRLAHLAAEACTIQTVGCPERLADLQAQAWGFYGNAQRVCGNVPEAEEALAIAFRKLAEGSNSPRLKGVLMTQASALRILQSRFGEAIQLAEEAGIIFRDLGETQILARMMVQKAIALLYSGETERAAEILRQAMPLIDQEEDPRLFLATHHNLARCYIDLDRPDEALALFVESKPLYQQCKDPLILLRATWQEGLLLREIGHLENAESALLRARKGFTEQGLAYETAMISLDLADVYAKGNRMEDLRRTIYEAMPIFRSLRVDREVLASLLRLQQAAGLEPTGEE